MNKAETDKPTNLRYINVARPSGYKLRSDWARQVQSVHYQVVEKATLVDPDTGLTVEITHQYNHASVERFQYELRILSTGTADLTVPGQPVWIAS